MEYVKTGIPDIDSLFAKGGFPKGKSILVLGGPGSGKSIFSMQYIYNGALDYNEPGVYVSLDQPPEMIRDDMEEFGWNLRGLEEEGKLIIVDAISGRLGGKSEEKHAIEAISEYEYTDSMVELLNEAIKKIGARRLVIDSISVMNLQSRSEFDARTRMLRMANALSKMKVTTLLVCEARTRDIGTDEFPIETYMFDGVIALHLDNVLKERKISIRKMRGTKHVLGEFRFQITDEGFSFIG
jgi:KaiC/GvpD/RAD55 family RecA-like ATPase